ncbi:3-hydroxyacyl-CoA dehydrogenase NAD-binding domain-containing protein [Oceaniglobus trochenteri]|uniref:3-hydroxyacyl-CoA dehydrogenase NAD-binding domain-containing protein n=1 Tax=Oceaniglobus trochenteri TaxID=2763260 RepID=UPI001CFFB029|nr:3-hydroxyacyl-CoA dehydrogenase NAD-binding domain-containing protein [Oceaniglobus trochenteri]
MQIDMERQGDVAVIRFANPPLNALDKATRGALKAALDDALSIAEVRAIVLAARGDDFCAGSDETTGGAAPSLGDLCLAIEGAQKPVIAALSGAVLGDGIDLAAACHYRVGRRDLRLGAPGIRLGLPPSGGATQRLPRLVGGGAALSLLLGGRARPAMEGFLDAPLAEDAVSAALAMAARHLAPRPTATRSQARGDFMGFMKAVAKARAASEGSPLDAPERIIACVEGALILPFETGLEMEQAAYADCLADPAGQALRHMARAEVAAARWPLATGGRARTVARVAITGGTARAGELALVCLDAGLEVLLVELEPEGQAAVLERLLDLYDDAVARGTLGEKERDARLLRVQPEATFDDLGSVDVIWEAGPDDPVLKREIWSAIGLLARPGALLLAAGDVIAPETLAELAERPEDLIGVQMPGPAHLASLAELLPPPHCSPDTVATALSLMRRLHRQPVLGIAAPGGLVQHLTQTLQQAIEALLIGGHSGETIDQALSDYGFRRAHCILMDARGLDHLLAHRQALRGDDSPQMALLDALVDSGLTGRAAGAGLFTWRDGAPEDEPPESRAVMEALAQSGVPCARDVTRADIAHLCAAALANAGAALLDAGAVAHAATIDVAAVHALGFPRWRGGPMMAADSRGLVRVERDIAAIGSDTPVSPLFSDCIKNGRALAGR